MMLTSLPNLLTLSRIVRGVESGPEYGSAFPARLLTTPLDWSDLVLQPAVRAEVDELRAWIEHRSTLLDTWQLSRHIKRGYRSLFYGPPGTGKTLTATLLGKSTGLDVYRIDLSLVVSKYIGETEKNLAHVFDEGERRWTMMGVEFTNFHRTLSTYVRGFLGAGFSLIDLIEPSVAEEQLALYPELDDELRVPNFIIYVLRKL